MYKAVKKPIMGKSLIIQYRKITERQSKLLRTIMSPPWYIRNNNILSDLNIPTIWEETKKANTSYSIKVFSHPYHLARNLLLFKGHRSLKRLQTMDNIFSPNIWENESLVIALAIPITFIYFIFTNWLHNVNFFGKFQLWKKNWKKKT